MKLTIQKITIAIFTLALLAGGVVLGLWFGNSPKSTIGATGSQFTMEHWWTYGTTTTSVIETTVPKATTTPTYIARNATSTVVVATAGVSDLRLNINMAASTTAKLTIDREIQSLFGSTTISVGDKDQYPVASLSATNVVTNDLPIAFTTASGTETGSFGQTYNQFSILLTNINAPNIRFAFGVNEPVGLSVEIVKIIPN